MNEKIALVTGASRGIGAETAKVLGRKGYSVCAHYYKNANLAEKVVENILKAGGSANGTQADISKEAEIVEMFEHIDKQYGSISALVNNAGFNGGFLISEEQVRLGFIRRIVPLKKDFNFDVYDLNIDIKGSNGKAPDSDVDFSLTSEEMATPISLEPDSVSGGS